MTQHYEQDDPQETLGDASRHYTVPAPFLHYEPHPTPSPAAPRHTPSLSPIPHPSSFVQSLPSTQPHPSLHPPLTSFSLSHPATAIPAQTQPSPILAPTLSMPLSLPHLAPHPAQLNLISVPIYSFSYHTTPNNSSPITHTHLSPPHPCSPLTPLLHLSLFKSTLRWGR